MVNGQQDQSNQGNYGQQQDQSNQGNQGGYGQQQDQSNQGGYGQQQDQSNQGNQDQSNQSGQQGSLDGARNVAQNQVDQAIDQFGSKIPGGSQYTQQAKDAAHGALDNLEKEGESRLGNLGGSVGGMFGGNNQNNQ